MIAYRVSPPLETLDGVSSMFSNLLRHVAQLPLDGDPSLALSPVSCCPYLHQARPQATSLDGKLSPPT